MPWAAHAEEAAALLSGYEQLFDFRLGGSGGGSSVAGEERAVLFDVPAALVTAANEATGNGGSQLGSTSARCNAVVLDTRPVFELGGDGSSADGGAEDCSMRRGSRRSGAPRLPPPQKRAVAFLEPFSVHSGESCTLSASHDGLRILLRPPATARAQAPAAVAGPTDGWGTMLLQHWHFAMVRDGPRNDAYAAAIARAAHRLRPARSRIPSPSGGRPSLAAIDLGAGSGLLSLLLARQIEHARGRAASEGVLGVEIMPGVVDLGRRCVRQNGCAHSIELVRAEGHQLCAQTARQPAAERPCVPLLVAELMDSGGLGEGLLPLAHDALSSGLVAEDAQLLPCRLRVWAFLAELRGSGTALDGAELLGSHAACVVSLDPWLRFHEIKNYASIDLSCAEYTPLSEEVLLFDATLGAPPPPDGVLRLRTLAAGRANAVVWTWEADLDESSPCLSNAPRAPKTHWRQAAHLLTGGPSARPSAGTFLTLRADEPVALGYRAISNGRELRFDLTADAAAIRLATPPRRSRPHAPKYFHTPPAEPPVDDEPTVAAAQASEARRTVRAADGVAARVAEGWRRRRQLRAPMPPPTPVAIDAGWREAMLKATVNAVEQFGLSPRGAGQSVALCEASLEIAANPGRYGVHPADGLQVVRLYYAN